MLLLFSFFAGGFPTQVLVCDLRGEKTTGGGIVLSGGHDVGLRLTTGAATAHALSSQHDSNPTTRLPKVTGFHRTTICATLTTFIWTGLNSSVKLCFSYRML